MESVSAEIGISVRALGSYERCEALPDIDFLARLADLADANINELIALRLQASGHDAAASQVGEIGARYVIDQSSVASHARQSIMQSDQLPQYWQLGIMELAAAGEITADGVERLITLITQP